MYIYIFFLFSVCECAVGVDVGDGTTASFWRLLVVEFDLIQIKIGVGLLLVA